MGICTYQFEWDIILDCFECPLLAYGLMEKEYCGLNAKTWIDCPLKLVGKNTKEDADGKTD